MAVDNTPNPQRFNVSDRCSSEQREIFDAINKGLDAFHISADEFDRKFRMNLMKQCRQMQHAVPTALLKNLPDYVREMLFKTYPSLRQEYPAVSQVCESILGPDYMMHVNFKIPVNFIDDAAAQNLLFTANQNNQQYIPDITGRINTYIGRFQDFDSRPMNPQERVSYEAFRQAVPADLQPKAAPVASQNFLQIFADGKPLAPPRKQQSSFAWSNEQVSFQPGFPSDYVAQALLNTQLDFARDKGWTEERFRQKFDPIGAVITERMRLMRDNEPTATISSSDTPSSATATPAAPRIEGGSSDEKQHFKISEQCSPEQRKIFEAINQGLDIIGISADDLDRHFRINLIAQCRMMGVATPIALINKLPEHVRQSLFSTNPQLAQRHPATMNACQNVLGPTYMVGIDFKQPVNDLATAQSLLSLFNNDERNRVVDVTRLLNKHIDRFQDFDPGALTAKERSFYDSFTPLLPADLQPKHEPSGTNFLQAFADGKPLIKPKQQDLGRGWQNETVNIRSGLPSDYISMALRKALGGIAVDKGWSQAQIQQRIEPLNAVILNSIQAMRGSASVVIPPPIPPSDTTATPSLYDINIPPLIIDRNVPAAAIEHVTNAWRSWPEYIRHLILHKEVRLHLQFREENNVTRVNPNRNCVEINAKVLPVWQAESENARQQVMQDLIYGNIMYDALLLAAPEIIHGVDWRPAIQEFLSTRSTPREDIPAILAAANNSQRVWERTGQISFRDKEPVMRAAWKLFHERTEQHANATVPALRNAAMPNPGQPPTTVATVTPPAAPRIENATDEQKALFGKAFGELPQDVRTAILRANTVFEIDSAGAHFSIKDNKVILPLIALSPHNVSMLGSVIFGAGLAQALAINIDENTISESLIELARNQNPAAYYRLTEEQRRAAGARGIAEAKKFGEKGVVALALMAAYGRIKELGQKDENCPHANSIYDAYMDASAKAQTTARNLPRIEDESETQARAKRETAERAAEEETRQNEERQRQAELRRQQKEDERRKQQEAKAFAPIPFVLGAETPAISSLIDVGGKSPQTIPAHKPKERAEQARLHDVVVDQMKPMIEALNIKLDEHAAFGKALFAGKKPQPLATTILNICGGSTAPVAVSDEFRDAAKAQIKRILTMPLDESPLHQANKERQQRLINALSNAPVVLVAALGTTEMVQKAKMHLEKIYPGSKQAAKTSETEHPTTDEIGLSKLAVETLKNAKISVPAPLLAASRRIAGQSEDQNGTIQELNERVENLIGDYRSRRPDTGRHGPVPIQFRCKQEMGAGFPILVELCDMEGHNWRRMRLRAQPPTFDIALELKQTVQGSALAMPNLYPYREILHGTVGLYDPGEVIPNFAPNPNSTNPRQDGGLWKLNLSFSENNRRVDIPVNLGLQQDQPQAEAEARRDWVINRLTDARTNHEVLTRGVLTEDLRQQYRNNWHEPLSREANGIPRQIGNTPVRVSNTTLSFRIPGTRLEIGPMVRERTPTPSWVVPVEFYPTTGTWKGRSILLCTEDENVADAKLAEFVTAIVQAENALADRHPGSRWDTDPDNGVLNPIGRTAYEAAKQARADGQRATFTDGDRWELARLAPPIFELGHAAVLRNIQPPADNGQSFTIAVMRGAPQSTGTPPEGQDNTQGMLEPVMERIGQRLERTVTVPTSMHNQIPAFVDEVNSVFCTFVRDAFDRRTNARYSPDGRSKEKAKEDYSTWRLTDALDRAIAAVQNNLASPVASDSISTDQKHSPAGGDTNPPGTPYHRHTPNTDQLEMVRGIRRQNPKKRDNGERYI